MKKIPLIEQPNTVEFPELDESSSCSRISSNRTGQAESSFYRLHHVSLNTFRMRFPEPGSDRHNIVQLSVVHLMGDP
jgi:hypothetical protein